MKISKETLRRIIKEEVARTLNEGKDVLSVHMAIGKAIPGSSDGAVVVVNKKYTGRDGKEYVRYSIYHPSVPVSLKGEKFESAFNAVERGYADLLDSGMSGERYVISVADFEANSKKMTHTGNMTTMS